MAATKTFSGTRLRELREATGYTREQVAVAVRRSWNAVYQYERGETCPSAKTQADLSALFEVPIDSFYVEVVEVVEVVDA